MAKEAPEEIYTAAAVWRDTCLIGDGSLFAADSQLWTPELLDHIYDSVIGSPLTDSRTFSEKFREQLGADQNIVRLGAEVLAVYFLMCHRSAITSPKKRKNVEEVLGWANLDAPADGPIVAALNTSGPSHPGQFYLVRRDVQIGFLIQFARAVKVVGDAAERQRLLENPWELRDLMDSLNDQPPAMRHVLLHLLLPDYFERIASGGHKRLIVDTYQALADPEVDDDDERLLSIRRELVRLLDCPIDFYQAPLKGTWGDPPRNDGMDPLQALELKRQLVLYGPPGTSKTYEARKIAENLIHRHALKTWGPVDYFRRQHDIEQCIQTHVRRLQLHPAYSYEEFIRGLRLHNGQTVYQPGYLLQLTEQIESSAGTELGEFPWILILDELNRADLSRVFGEAFSALEDRDHAVELAGVEPNETPVKLKLPENLFIIGTMNLIDQSLEQIDFALRRRFLWQLSDFDPARLIEVLEERWNSREIAERYPWEKVNSDMEVFASRAVQLNERIADSGLLGVDYKIGHTYFFDIVGLLEKADYLHRKNRSARFLFNGAVPLAPVEALWEMSLAPLLNQYLQGIDADARLAELGQLKSVFLQLPPR